MKVIQLFGAVVAVHLVAFMILFAVPGCRSTGPQAKAPAATDPSAASVTFAGGSQGPISAAPETTPGLDGHDLNPAITSAPAGNTASSGIRYNPTRPDTAEATALKTPVAPAAPAAVTYTVASGDSLWSIAKKNGLTVRELAVANDLNPQTQLKIGQKLVIPAVDSGPALATASGPETGEYTVVAGDSLGAIARRSGTTVAALKSANNLKSDTVRIGQKLKIPGSGVVEAARPSAAANTTTMTHTVASGETLGVIARRYQVKVGDLAAANNIADPAKIRVGQKLIVPGWRSPSGGTAPATTTTAAKTAAPSVPAATTQAPAATFEKAPVFTVPSADQDLDAGLPATSTTEAPVIKIEDSGAPVIE